MMRIKLKVSTQPTEREHPLFWLVASRHERNLHPRVAPSPLRKPRGAVRILLTDGHLLAPSRAAIADAVCAGRLPSASLRGHRPGASSFARADIDAIPPPLSCNGQPNADDICGARRVQRVGVPPLLSTAPQRLTGRHHGGLRLLHLLPSAAAATDQQAHPPVLPGAVPGSRRVGGTECVRHQLGAAARVGRRRGSTSPVCILTLLPQSLPSTLDAAKDVKTLSHCISHRVSLTVSPTVPPSPCLPPCLAHRVSHCVSLTVSRTVSPPPSLPLRLPHRVSHCVFLCDVSAGSRRRARLNGCVGGRWGWLQRARCTRTRGASKRRHRRSGDRQGARCRPERLSTSEIQDISSS
jgi:hypothetical protein